MSFLQSSGWTFTTNFQNPEGSNHEQNPRKPSYDFSNLSTRKDSNDSLDFKFRYKTQVCKYWINGEYCPFESFCSFAHGFIEKRSRENLPSKYKTKICKNWMNNICCSYGTRCQFLHPQYIQNQFQNCDKHTTFLNSIGQNPELSFLYSKRLKIFKQITDSSTMKELIGQDYESPSNAFNQSSPFFNGKPRFYSI